MDASLVTFPPGLEERIQALEDRVGMLMKMNNHLVESLAELGRAHAYHRHLGWDGYTGPPMDMR